jgi:prepilin-type N-terminal cleavage/methylation domain-containing protein/prepilin-type processing-associated H-X9-DG protein
MKKRAFTLVELLVVIAIIALLMGILMPSLRKARAQAMRIVCISNQRQLTMAWILYADDNDGKIVRSSVTLLHIDENSWVKWTGSLVPTFAQQIEGIKEGALYPYVQSVDVYRCPAGLKDEARNYNIPNALNGRLASEPFGEIKKICQIRNAGKRLVFIDQGEIPLIYTGDYPHRNFMFDDFAWRSKPGGARGGEPRHPGGASLGFADGSALFYHWKDPLMDEYVALEREVWDDYYSSSNLDEINNNEDCEIFHRFVWGKKDPSPQNEF